MAAGLKPGVTWRQGLRCWLPKLLGGWQAKGCHSMVRQLVAAAAPGAGGGASATSLPLSRGVQPLPARIALTLKLLVAT
jgi:hypothetical protein